MIFAGPISSYKFHYKKQKKHGRGGRVSGILLSDISCLIWASVSLIIPLMKTERRVVGVEKYFLPALL